MLAFPLPNVFQETIFWIEGCVTVLAIYTNVNHSLLRYSTAEQLASWNENSEVQLYIARIVLGVGRLHLSHSLQFEMGMLPLKWEAIRSERCLGAGDGNR